MVEDNNYIINKNKELVLEEDNKNNKIILEKDN